ncbi:MAG: hypothetical protein Q9219_005756 [cf. Caloplaca sp. 3 TL-2023]
MNVLLEEPDTEVEETRNSQANRLPRMKPTGKLRQPVHTTSEWTPAANAVPAAAVQDSSEPLSRRRTADPETTRRVEAIINRIICSLQQQQSSVSIALKTRKSSDSSLSRSNKRPLKSQYKLSFPGSTPQEAWRFSTAELTQAVCRRTSSMLTCSPAVVLRIMELIHEALVQNIVISKRNIYYKDPDLFTSQTVVDRYVDILAYTLGVERAVLNVAKGYPDVSTRAFLRLLSISGYPPPPVLALVDFDPDGIAIMSTYKHGSVTLSHENANLKTPVLRWLGVKSSDLVTDEPGKDSRDEIRKGLLRLSSRDRKKATKMLEKEICEETGAEQEWRRELQVMLMLNLKVEMEILCEREAGMESWFKRRLSEECDRSGVNG